MKARPIALVLCAIVILFARHILASPFESSYVQMSGQEIAQHLLRDVPLGSSSTTVRAYLKQQTGRDALYEENGTTLVANPVPGAKPRFVPRHFDGLAMATLANIRYLHPYVDAIVKPEPSVTAWAKKAALCALCYTLGSTDIISRWEFDRSDRLIAVTVTKRPTGP